MVDALTQYLPHVLLFLIMLLVVYLLDRSWGLNLFRMLSYIGTGSMTESPGKTLRTTHEYTIKEEAYVHFLKAQEYYKRGEFLYAIDEYALAIDLDPDPVYYNNRGCAKLSVCVFNSAKDDFSIALSMDDSQKVIWGNRGIAWFHLDNISKACSDWRKAYSLGYEELKKWLDQYCPCRHEKNEATLKKSGPRRLPPVIPKLLITN